MSSKKHTGGNRLWRLKQGNMRENLAWTVTRDWECVTATRRTGHSTGGLKRPYRNVPRELVAKMTAGGSKRNRRRQRVQGKKGWELPRKNRPVRSSPPQQP